jgi:hypothetical protein
MADREERIRQRAHEIWRGEGEPHGRHSEHWHQAVAEINAEDAAQVDHVDSKTKRKDLKQQKPRAAKKPAGTAGQVYDMGESFAPEHLDAAIDEANRAVDAASGKPAKDKSKAKGKVAPAKAAARTKSKAPKEG